MFDSLISALEARGVTSEQVDCFVQRGDIDAVVRQIQSAQPPAPIRCISEGIELTVGPTDGQRNIAHAGDVFKAGIDPGFVRWGLDHSGKPTEETKVVVHELAQNATFAQMFAFLTPKLDRLVFEQDQVIDFCEKHMERLSRTGWTFFLLLNEGKYFVAGVYVGGSSKLGVHVLGFEYGYAWYAMYGLRLVSPQL